MYLKVPCHKLHNKNLQLSQTDRAYKLCTQYVEGIDSNLVTLKSSVRVTHGYWKRNHWIDHTRLIISRVIWRSILSWPWNVG